MCTQSVHYTLTAFKSCKNIIIFYSFYFCFILKVFQLMICFAQINMTEVLKASELRVPMPPENMSINRDRSGEHHQNMDGPPQPAHAHFTPPTSVSDLELLQHRVNWGTFSKLSKKVYLYKIITTLVVLLLSL